MQRNIFFTVVLPTRNRPETFILALNSVLKQSFTDFEVIVINDGSSEEYLPFYKEIQNAHASNVHFHYLVYRPNGHGQSYSMNTGVYMSCGKYVCFLDDDDYWTDMHHLQRAFDSITNSKNNIDVYYTNQLAYFSDGVKNENNIWINDLISKATTMNQDKYGVCRVTTDFLLSSKGFAHLNCSIIRREFYLSINGMDENIRYECDRDIYLRTIDVTDNILYYPGIISKHNIPDPQKKENMSTSVSVFEKRLYQTSVFMKGILFSQKQCIKTHCKNGLSYIFKHITEDLVKRKKFKDAALFSKKALALNFNFKWWVYSIYLSLLSLLRG